MAVADILQVLAVVAEGSPAAPAEPRSAIPMIIIGVILLATFAAIAFEVYHKSLAALLGAIVAVIAAMLLGVFPGEKPYAAVYEFIAEDLKVIGVIVGTSILVEITASTGLFHFVAIRIVKMTGGQPVMMVYQALGLFPEL